jgi:hypothetical protein
MNYIFVPVTPIDAIQADLGIYIFRENGKRI